MKSLLKIAFFGIFLFSFVFQSCKTKQSKDTFTDTTNAQQIQLDSVNYWTAEVEADPKNAQKLYKLGEAYYEADGYDMAILSLQTAISIDSTRPEYFHLLADTYLDYHDKSYEALETIQRAAGLFPDRVPTLLKLSEFQLILKQYGRSIETVKQILAIDPFNAEAFFMMGMNFKEGGDTARAINSFQTCVEQDADHLDAYLNLALLCDKTGRDKLALTHYNNAIQIDSLNVNVWYMKAMFFTKRKRDNEAIETYEKIHQLDRDFPDAYFNKGAIYFDYDSLDKAYYNFDLSVKVEPTYAKGYFWRGVVAERQGKIAQAKSDYEQTLVFDEEFKPAQDRLDALEN